MGGESEKSGRSKSGRKEPGCCERLTMSMGGGKNGSGRGDLPDFQDMTPEQKKKRMTELWKKAQRYTNKLRFQARLQKMAESNLKEMMIDDINEDVNEEVQHTE